MVKIETHPNGGASVLKTDWRKVREKLNKEERHEFARQFIRLGVAEKKGCPFFVIAILENAAEYLMVSVIVYVSTKLFRMFSRISTNNTTQCPSKLAL